jgi:bifunctional non-homologous end joining protein LigD
MLKEYAKKRRFTRTSEPSPGLKPGEGPLTFVVQKHAARRLHYDFRLEVDGVLKSWAIPNGPSFDPKVKRLAVRVEDHPIEYQSFEGSIPEGEYGAGQVMVWDKGFYSPDDEGKSFFDDRGKAQESIRNGLEKGKISIVLKGNRLKGSWALVKMQPTKNDWLLIKHQDEFADADPDILKEDTSVLSGRTMRDIKENRSPPKLDFLDPGKIPGARPSAFGFDLKKTFFRPQMDF